MNRVKLRIVGTTGAALLSVPSLVVLSAGAGMAADGNQAVAVSNTETVQVFMDPTGQVDVARVYEQVAMSGKGSVDLVNPIEPSGLRNLDGFRTPDVVDGNMVGTFKVDGERRLRTVSSFTKTLPLDVRVTYMLDGQEVKPGDVVGKDGELEVSYTVRNITGASQELSFDDGIGGVGTATEDVVIPMVGSLTTVLPSNFTNVRSTGANMAGDGRGGMKMSFTMTLFGPIGSPEASFGYTATVRDGVVPSASISALPVNPLESPSFKGAAASYQGGADTGVTLTGGASTIDTNLLKLRDGAGALLAGLIQLRDGAKTLNIGLSDTAVPGAFRLADGARQASSGAARLNAGLSDLDDGANQLAAGTNTLTDGSAQLADGAGRLSAGAAGAADGAGQLADGSAQVADGLDAAGAQAPQLLGGLAQVAAGLDKVDAGLTQLSASVETGGGDLDAGIQQLVAGLGSKSEPTTLIGGVDAARSGIAGLTADGGDLDKLRKGTDDSKAGVDASKAGVDEVNSGLSDAAAQGGAIDRLAAGVVAAQAADCGPACSATLDAVAEGIAQLKAQTQEATAGLTEVSGGLGQVSPGLGGVSTGIAQVKAGLKPAADGLAKVECGLSNTSLTGVCDADTPGLLEGLGRLEAGVNALVGGVVSAVGVSSDTQSDQTLRGGVHSLQDGVDEIGIGGVALIDGLDQLSAGAGIVASGNADLADGVDQLATGANDLSSGASRLDAGANKLADGAGRLADGTETAKDGAGQLANGNAQLAAGSDQLATGLGAAADGSFKLSDGLGTASDKAPALEDGAQRLSDEGTQKIIAAGQATAADYGAKYAALEAGALRAQDEGMAYGAPEGATGTTAYSIELAGATGESGGNTGRALGAAAVFALAGGALLLRRRV